MVYSYTPKYYSTFHDTITSLCKSILPFSSFKSHRLTADQKLAKRHSDNLKWQQDSFHRILNLVGLQREGIARETKVAAFRTHLLETLIVAPKEQEPAGVIRDKLLFFQIPYFLLSLAHRSLLPFFYLQNLCCPHLLIFQKILIDIIKKLPSLPCTRRASFVISAVLYSRPSQQPQKFLSHLLP